MRESDVVARGQVDKDGIVFFRGTAMSTDYPEGTILVVLANGAVAVETQ